jgi:hypothetical protein
MRIIRYHKRKKVQLLRFLNDTGDKNNRSTLLPVTVSNPWLVAGASVTGRGHRLRNLPCQDAHLTQVWDNGWGVAVVSDGAGSAAKSHLASAFMAKEAVHHAGLLVRQMRWMEKDTLPTFDEWRHEANTLMDRLHNAILSRSEKWNISLRELHATLIIVVFSPHGLLVVHRGDGRAGGVDMQGRYHTLIQPWEGEQVGQTVFMTIGGRHNGITRVAFPVKAFFLLTDGCERVCWEMIRYNDSTGTYEKMNKPFVPFFNQAIDSLQQMQTTATPETIADSWFIYLDRGYKGFANEEDDKTMVIGLMMNNVAFG